MLFFALMTFILLETGGSDEHLLFKTDGATVHRQVFEDPLVCEMNAMLQRSIIKSRDDVAYSHVVCVMEHHL